MSYLVLARKWRPMRFEDLVGQDHVARTLGNAIRSGRVAHAFLFTGVRGVGKTTSARILAKALNCMGDPETTTPGTDRGPTVEPCLKCAACLEIAQGTDMDVREIDGASYNGVDEVRKLQDSIPYRPSRDRFKIYIVDEVHMLSTNAWNAFLKTLEEPPPHVKFIFATTEVHKVPITILSRVQRFDFKMIGAQVIAARLRYVLEQEHIRADDAAVSLVAREAAGSMRDAMSLLDQLIAWGGNELAGDEVARVLGVVAHSVLYQLAQALIAGDAAGCLSIVADLSDQGQDIGHAARDLMTLLRNLVVAKVAKDPTRLLDLPDSEASDVKRLAETASTDDLIRLHQGFAASFDDVLRSGQPRAAWEMLLVRLARRPALMPIDVLVQRLGTLERRLNGGGGGAVRGGPPPAQRQGGPQIPPAAPAAMARPREPQSAAPRPAEPSGERKEPPSSPAQSAPVASTPSAPVASAPPASAFAPPASAFAPPASAFAPPASAFAPPRSAPPSAPGPASAAARSAPPQNGSPVRSAAPRSAPPESNGAPSRTLDPEDVLRAVVSRIATTRAELAAKLEHAVALEVSSSQMVLGWAPDNLFTELVATPENTAVVEQALSAMFKQPVRLVHERDSARAIGKKTLSNLEAEARAQRRREAYERARAHPRLAEALEVLGARLRDLRLAKIS